MSLSSLIVEREIASIREVEEALARQVLYGGDFVTNLLEVCRLDEGALGAVVADFFALQVAPSGELPAAQGDAARALAPAVAAQRSIFALSMDQNGIVLAVPEPLGRDVEQELAFALAVPLTQRVAPLVRIRQALARDHGIPMDRRLVRLLGKMTGETPRVPSGARAPVVTAPPRAPSAPPAPALPLDEPMRSGVSGAPSTLVRDRAAPLAPFRRRRGPLDAEAAQTELEDAAARDRILDIVFDFARQYFDYTAIFLVHGDLAEGRDGWGEGASREKVVRLGVPLDFPGVMTSARNAKARVRTSGSADGLDAVLLADLGRKPGTELVAVPLVVRTRVVAMLLGDGGEGGLDDAGITELEGVVEHAVAAFERLIVRRKLQGTLPPEGGLAPPKDPRDNPNLEGALQVVIARARHPSVPPAAEELAAPVRELMSEPISIARTTRRDPTAAEDLGDPPPPPNVFEVRKHAGPPIPREEPEGGSGLEDSGPKTRVSGTPAEPASSAPRAPDEELALEKRRKSSGALRKPEAPPLSFDGGGGYGEDDVERRLIAEIQGRAPEAVETPASPPADEMPFLAMRPRGATDLSPGIMLPAHRAVETPMAPLVTSDGGVDVDLTPPVFAPAPAGPARSEIAAIAEALRPKAASDAVSDGEDEKRPPETVKLGSRRGRDKPMPASEQQVSVSAYRPPSSHQDVTRVLPAVIVDVEDAYESLVLRVLDHDDEDAEAELLRAGAKAMPTLMSKFPGAITVARTLLEDGLMPRARDCGPILRLVATQRRVALPHVLDRVDSKNDDERIWATYLLGELLYPEAVDAAVPRIFDEHPVVRRLARLALRGLAEAHPGLVVDKLGAVAKGREQPTVRRTRAVEALGETREASAVPVLVSLVNDTAGAVANASRIALVGVTRQDFGHDPRAWFDWWDANGERHRLEWLIDALTSESTIHRAAAGEELKALTKEYFGFHEDLPKREREKVQARYRQWWNDVGRVRFSRSLGPRSSPS
jgi:hypothetical protein